MIEKTAGVGEFFHIFNRGVDKRVIFPDHSYFGHFVSMLRHYLVYDYRYSLFVQKLRDGKDITSLTRAITRTMDVHKWKEPLVEILSFCLMPNHYHLMLRELVQDGISTFMHRIGTSYTNYFNLRNERSGSLYEGSYKMRPVESEGQFLCLNRYIHVNPISAGLVTAENFLDWPWSSLPQYLGRDKNGFCSTKDILHYFSSGGEKSKERQRRHFKDEDDYLKFVLADFSGAEQQSLEGLTIDDDFGWFKERQGQKKKLQHDFVQSLRRS